MIGAIYRIDPPQGRKSGRGNGRSTMSFGLLAAEKKVIWTLDAGGSVRLFSVS